ncbi:MAG TPA: tail fiber domain-containing protein [Pyrinomonadaceae bacterium]
MKIKRAIIFVILALALAGGAFAQSSAFNYQGRLNDTGAAAAGTFQFQFKLYDAASGGNQVGSTLSDVSVSVTNGTFSVSLDFGAAAFSGTDRYLEIAVRKTAGDSYTTLTPRQKINSAPYSNKANTANSATNFSGNLTGDVTGTQNATVVTSVGGQTSTSVAGAVQATTNATSVNTANTIVKRDANGRFAAAGITFGDGTTLTTANVGGGVNLLTSQNNWTGQNTFNGISLNNTNLTNVANPVSTTDGANKGYVDANTIRFVPGNTPQLSVGDANGTAPMIFLRGQSTCCGAGTGFADFKVFQNGSFVAQGNLGIGVSPMQGKGYRTSWDSYKGAFRSGFADAEWDDANVGFFSWAGGSNSTAIGLYALAFGDTNQAESTSSIVFGSGNQVKGAAGFSAGAGNRVCDTYGVAFGNKAQSGGPLINGKCDPDSFNIRGLAAIAMGYNVTASQDHTMAFGKFASNNGFSGTFIWSDGSATASADTFKNTANNEFAARATGGFRFRTNLGGTTGCNLPAGSGVFNCTSSRSTKENFTTIKGGDILSKLRLIPVTSWNYIDEGARVRHIGPMAEDFWGQFSLGVGNTSIGVQDLAGVSIAAVKELDTQLQEKTAEIERLQTEIKQMKANQTELEKRLAAIEQAIKEQK